MTAYVPREGEYRDREWLAAATILRVEVGSTVHGISVGNDDLDHMGICIEPLGLAVTTSAPFEQHIFRSAAVREGRQDAPSAPGDLDLCIYSLRKWCRLALDGNPSVILPLFVPSDKIVAMNAHGIALRDLAPAFASKHAIGRFLGYLQAQRQKLTGERGGRGVNRPELIAEHGFDTKYATHMLRLGYQGVEYAETGRLTLPIGEPRQNWLKQVRRGEIDLNTILTRCGIIEQQLMDLKTTSPLPDEPDTERVDQWMSDVYIAMWHADRESQRTHTRASLMAQARAHAENG